MGLARKILYSSESHLFLKDNNKAEKNALPAMILLKTIN
jgi:hypothetical protein